MIQSLNFVPIRVRKPFVIDAETTRREMSWSSITVLQIACRNIFDDRLLLPVFVEPIGSVSKYSSLTQIVWNPIALLILKYDSLTIKSYICCIKHFVLQVNPLKANIRIIHFMQYHNITTAVTITYIIKWLYLCSHWESNPMSYFMWSHILNADRYTSSHCVSFSVFVYVGSESLLTRLQNHDFGHCLPRLYWRWKELVTRSCR
jgi:hypothetical protein